MDIVELYVMDIILIFFNTRKHYICDVDNWFYGGLLSWNKRVAYMVLQGNLNSYWEYFLFFGIVHGYC